MQQLESKTELQACPTAPSTSTDSDSDAEATGSSSTQAAFELPQVPWGRRKIFQVMMLWMLAYIIIGQVAVPMGLSVLGIDREALTVRGHAVLHLFLDLTQLGVTLLILWQCLKKYKPRSKGLFPIRWGGNWPLVVLAACMVFPAVDWLAQQSLVWFPVDSDNWAMYMEASLTMGDWITNVAYFSVVSICAPIWEEAIFRGFLLASLARYMPAHWAGAATSLLFAMCHFRLQTFLPLLVLGMVFSGVFLVTRNLLPTIVLHSAWNVFVLCRIGW